MATILATPLPPGHLRSSITSLAAVQLSTDQHWRLLPDLSDDERTLLREDIREHGVRVAVEVDQDGQIVDGHHRVEIARDLGLSLVPVRMRAYASDEERLHVALSLNCLRRHLSPLQRRTVVGLLRARGWSAPRIAETLRAGRQTVYHDLRRLDAEGVHVEPPGGVVEGITRKGQTRPYTRRRTTGPRPPTGAVAEAKVGREWLPATPEDVGRLVTTATTELLRWHRHHQQHLREVPAFAAAFRDVAAAIACLPG